MAVSPKQWVFTLGALGIITAANLSAPVHYLTFVIFVLGTQSLMIGPVLIVVFSPKHSSRFIDMSNAWMERNNRRIVIAMSVIFGAFFFYKGASQLFS